jgi:hypothetical protein
MKFDDKALVVNFFGGPGVGKSTMALGVTFALKLMQIPVEIVPEVAKGMLQEGRKRPLLEWQAYVTAKQHRDLDRSRKDVDIVVTDSPVLNGCFYKSPGYTESFDQFWLERHHEMNSLNFLLLRNPNRAYDPIGRYQDEDGAKQVDDYIANWLTQHGVEHHLVEGTSEGMVVVLKRILEERKIEADWDRLAKVVGDFSGITASLKGLYYGCTSMPNSSKDASG